MLHSSSEEEKYDVNRWTYFYTFMGTFVMPMALATLTIFLRYDDDESALYTSKEWLDRMEKSGCKADTLDPAIILHFRHFEHSAIVAVATGSLFGQFYEHQAFANTGKLNSSQWLWYRTSLPVSIGRCVLTLLITGPVMAIRFFTPAIVFSMKDGYPLIARVLVNLCLVQFVPFFFTAFVAFAFLRVIFTKLRLDNADAIGKEFDQQENYFVQSDIQSIELGSGV